MILDAREKPILGYWMSQITSRTAIDKVEDSHLAAAKCVKICFGLEIVMMPIIFFAIVVSFG